MLTLDKPAPQTGRTTPGSGAPGRLGDLGDWSVIGPLLLILALSASLYMVLGANWPKFSRAEVFFAECSREMLAQGNFVTPLYHGKPFFDKPILMYWLIVGAFKTLGVTHLTARLPSILAALAAVAVTGSGCAVWFGRRAGLLAAMALSSSFMFLSFAALCMSDMLLVFFDTATMALLYAGVVRERRRTLLWWLASLSMGLAFLTKGPVGIVLPAASFVLYMAVTGQLRLLRAKHVVAGALTAAVVASPWFLAAWNANGTSSMYWFFIRENLQRFAGSTYDTHKPVWFMIASLFTGFAPWSVFLPLALWGSIRQWRLRWQTTEARRELYLWLWIAVVTGFFSVSRGKIDYYVLPAYPAAAVLVGVYLSRWIAAGQRPAVAGAWAMAAALLLAGVGAAYFLAPMSGNAAVSQWILMPASLVGSGLLMALCLSQRSYVRAYTLGYVGLCLAVVGFSLQILPAVTRLQPVVAYSAVVRESDRSTVVGMYRNLEHWVDEVTFQTAREPRRLDGISDVVTLLSAAEPALVMLPRDVFQELPYEVLSSVRLIDSRAYISHALNPGYALKRKGRLAGDVPLLLISNSP